MTVLEQHVPKQSGLHWLLGRMLCMSCLICVQYMLHQALQLVPLVSLHSRTRTTDGSC